VTPTIPALTPTTPAAEATTNSTTAEPTSTLAAEPTGTFGLELLPSPTQQVEAIPTETPLPQGEGL
jgi:hypothetical protein